MQSTNRNFYESHLQRLADIAIACIIPAYTFSCADCLAVPYDPGIPSIGPSLIGLWIFAAIIFANIIDKKTRSFVKKPLIWLAIGFAATIVTMPMIVPALILIYIGPWILVVVSISHIKKLRGEYEFIGPPRKSMKNEFQGHTLSHWLVAADRLSLLGFNSDEIKIHLIQLLHVNLSEKSQHSY